MEFCRFLCSVKFVVRSPVDFLGAVFACGYSGVRVAAFFEKLATGCYAPRWLYIISYTARPCRIIVK